jgi:HEAT repeat protein
VPGGKEAFDRKLAELTALRENPDSPETLSQLRKALKDRSNYIVAKVAALVGDLGAAALIPDLLAAFDRFLKDAAKTDPQCWAKNALIKALKDLSHDDPAVYLRGIEHVQMEPVWGGQVDTAGSLRGACALALAACPIEREKILPRLVDLLVDSQKPARLDTIRAMARLPGLDSMLALRVKALVGDAELEVVGTCFDALLVLSPAESTPFVARFLESDDDDVRLEAAAALAVCGEPEAFEVVKACFAKAPADLRATIVRSLSASRLTAAAEFLLSVIAEGSAEDAADAVAALAKSRFHDEFRPRAEAAVRRRASTSVTAAFQKEFAAGLS